MSAARAASVAVGPWCLRGLRGLRQGRRATGQTGPGEEQLLITPRAAQATLQPAWVIDQAGDLRSASQLETHPHPPPGPETHPGSTTGSSSPEATGASGTRTVSMSDTSTPAALQRSGRRTRSPPQVLAGEPSANLPALIPEELACVQGPPGPPCCSPIALSP